MDAAPPNPPALPAPAIVFAVPVPCVDRVKVFRADRIVAVYRGFPISHVQLTTGHWVYDIIDPRSVKVATVLSQGAAQVWIDDRLQAK